MKMKVFLYRHGSISLPDNEKRFIGRSDLPLGEEGRKQMYRAALNYAWEAKKIYASTSSRCVESARIFVRAQAEKFPDTSPPELVLREDLREIHLGEWEGKSFAQIRAQAPLEFERRGEKLPDYRVPGGETFREVQERAVRAVYEICEESDREGRSSAVIITHLGVIRTLRCYLAGIPLSRMLEWSLPYSECYLEEASFNITVKSLSVSSK